MLNNHKGKEIEIDVANEFGYYFIEQDEDLILHQPHYIPILIELAADENCPKQKFCEAILEYYIQQQLLYRRIDSVKQILKRTKEAKKIIQSEWLKKWYDNLLKNTTLLQSPRTLSIDECEELAYALSIGDYCKRHFLKSRTLPNGTIEFLASTTSFKLFFYINPTNGNWGKSTNHPLTHFE